VARYSRYVAIGDSQTEGLWDGDDSVGLRGFADRLAEIVDAHWPGLMYANLAVRGGRIRDLLDDQLPHALAMDPDLVTVCIGMNDVTRPGPNFDHALAELEDLHAQLALSGATVVTTTFPDLAQIIPIGRVLVARVLRINEEIRRAADWYDFRLVDLYNAPSMTHRTLGAPTGCTAHRWATPFSPPRPPRRWVCLGATMIGPKSAADPPVSPSCRRRTRRRCGRRTCSCPGCGGTCGAGRPATAGRPGGRG
jgi:lysophospholipase L1-like esterase